MIKVVRQPPIFFFWLLVLLGVCFIASLLFGSVAVPLSDIAALFTGDSTKQTAVILLELRLPRSLLAILIGALLASSGAAMQGLFRNPLADPSLIGVSAGASLGASLVIFFGAGLSATLALSSSWQLPMVSLGAILGGALAVLFVYHLATKARVTSVTTMLLAGVALTAFVGGFTNFLEFFSDNATLRQLSLWRMGNLENASYERVSIACILFFICMGLLYKHAHALNAFLLGESEARHLGVNVDKTKRTLIMIVATGTGISLALAGTIVFIGLVVPHIMRIFVGPNHRVLLAASALGGAILLLLSDTLARVVMAPIELPVGLLTAFIGAPFFVLLLRRNFHYGF